MRLRSVLLALAILCQAPAFAAEFRPATPVEAAAIVTADDAYMRGLTPADLSIRLRRPEGGSRAALKAQYAAAVELWSEADAARLTALAARHRDKLDALARWLPDTVLFIRASGGIDGGLPHTRANAIVMGPALPAEEGALDSLFFHELFHVLSRHASADTRASLYALIGFERCSRTKAPRRLRNAGISNPDVEDPAFTVDVTLDGAPATLMPFLRAAPSRYESGKPAFETYFDLTFLRMRRDERGVCRVDTRRGQPREVAVVEALGPLFARVGANTRYVVHAEETLADNFSYLMLGRTDLPDMWVLERLRERLTRGP